MEFSGYKKEALKDKDVKKEYEVLSAKSNGQRALDAFNIK